MENLLLVTKEDMMLQGEEEAQGKSKAEELAYVGECTWTDATRGPKPVHM